jgi:hypothetical protein
MAVLEIYSPRFFSLYQNSTVYVANPWATKDKPASDIWIQCTINCLSTVSEQGFSGGIGIIEYEHVDEQGQIQRETFGGTTDLDQVSIFQLPPRLFVRRLVSVTVANIASQGGFQANGGIGALFTSNITLFLWG